MSTGTTSLSFFAITTLVVAFGNAQWVDVNLGTRIAEDVQRSLAPLRDLDKQISAQMAHLGDLNGRIHAQVRASTAHLDNLGEQINAQVQASTAHLSNLSQEIQKEVDKGLEPVRALEAINQVKYGLGGTTVATYHPSEKKLLVRDGIAYQCSGSISETNGECRGTEEKFKPTKDEEYCYSNNKAIINNYVCLASSSVSVSVINNQITCRSRDGESPVLIPLESYKETCKNVNSVDYLYFPRGNVNLNKIIQCTGGQPPVCKYSESASLDYSQVNIVSGDVVIRS